MGCVCLFLLFFLSWVRYVRTFVIISQPFGTLSKKRPTVNPCPHTQFHTRQPPLHACALLLPSQRCPQRQIHTDYTTLIIIIMKIVWRMDFSWYAINRRYISLLCFSTGFSSNDYSNEKLIVVDCRISLSKYCHEPYHFDNSFNWLGYLPSNHLAFSHLTS